MFPAVDGNMHDVSDWLRGFPDADSENETPLDQTQSDDVMSNDPSEDQAAF